MREVLPVAFGAGLDRATGALATNPASFWDLRNVILKDDKIEARGGLTRSGALLTTVGDVVGIFPFRAIKAAVGVGYNRTTRELSVWRLDAVGAWVENLGVWATLIPGAELAQPIVIAAEHKGILFLAHDEPLYNYRAQSFYYDPSLPAGAQLVGLTADFNGDLVNEPVYFRGFRQYLSYMFGWGHGAESRPNAPEIVRFSQGAAPLIWPKNYYFIAGAADEAVTNCAAAGNRLIVMKKGESHAIDGNNAKNFSIRPIEKVHGTLNGRLGVELGGAFFYWSETGPRVTTGQESIDLGLPLELDAPEPSSLVAKGQEFYGWCVQDPLRRIIMWGFPEIEGTATLTRVYTLSIRDPERFKWSYMEIGQHIHSAGLVIEGVPIVGTELTGWASNVILADDGLYQTGRQIDVQWTNNSLIGGEFVEVWRQLEIGPWEVVEVVAASGGSQQVTINGPDKPFQALADYEIALRYIKDGRVTPGFEGGPATWTHANQAQGKGNVTTLAEAPTIDACVWARINDPVFRVTFTVSQQETGLEIELEDTTEPVGTWAGANGPYLELFDGGTDDLTFDPPVAQLGTYRNYRMRAARSTYFSPWSTTKLLFMGPPAVDIPIFWIFQSTITNDFDLFLYDLPAGAKLDVEVSEQGVGTWTRQFFASAVGDPQNIASTATFDNVAITDVRARFMFQTAGIDDPSPWSAVQSILLTNEAVPSAPAGFTSTVYNEANDIDVNFAAGGGAIGRLMHYADTVDPNDKTFFEVNSAAVLANFADLFHFPLTADKGPDWEYDRYAGLAASTIGIDSYAIDRTGGRAKISAKTVEAVPKIMVGAVSGGFTVVPFGIDRVTVSWNNNRGDGDCDVNWALAAGGPMHRLFAPIAIPGTTQKGPALGYAALPTSGTAIKVRIWVRVTVSGTVYRTAFVDVNYSMP